MCLQQSTLSISKQNKKKKSTLSFSKLSTWAAELTKPTVNQLIL